MSAPEVHEGVVLPPSNGGQPVLSTAVVVTAVAALIALLASFGLPITDEQESAIRGFLLVAAPIATALLARRKVTPNRAVAAYATVEGELVAGPQASATNGSLVSVRPWPGAKHLDDGKGDAVGDVP